ncbi:MAG TPA: hypothetical protein ENI67_08565 [Gammaproteobacteria bacterium]|nr:hypothetical protein [Gammaproteobacteria bacterium]
MYKPKNLNEYLHLIDDAVFEMEELIYCAEEEFDNEMDGMTQSFQVIVTELKKFQTAVKASEIVPGEFKDEGFLPLVVNMQSGRIPVQHLLKELDRIARQGLNED